jgi:Fe-S-cluster containining protein
MPWDFTDLVRLHAAVGEKCSRQEALGGIQCRKGCYHCCRRIASLFPVEFAHLGGDREFPPGPLESRLHPGEALCGHLAPDGSCGIYDRRPLICRTHGFLHLSEAGLDHCPWNFEDLDEVDEDLPFHLEDLHETLSRVNILFLRRSYPTRWKELAQVRIRFQ